MDLCYILMYTFFGEFIEQNMSPIWKCGFNHGTLDLDLTMHLMLNERVYPRYAPINSQLRDQVTNVYVVVSPL